MTDGLNPWSGTMTKLEAWFRQPSTLLAAGLLVGGAVYWITASPALALTAASIIPGACNDHSASLLTRIEGVEDGLRANTRKLASVDSQVSGSSLPERPAFKARPTL